MLTNWVVLDMRQPSFWRSVAHAWAGLVYTFRTQRNARWHVIAALAVIALGAWLKIDSTRFAILILTIGAVCAGEAINTTVEALVDLMSPDWHERAKVAKDVSAGAVLLLGITAMAVGLLVLGPPLWDKVFG
jgi:diacylglycerol kinase